MIPKPTVVTGLRKSLFIVGEFYSFMSDLYLSAKAVTYNCDRLLLQHRSMFISRLDINISKNSCSQTHIKHKMADITHTNWDFLDFTLAESEMLSKLLAIILT